MNTVLTGKEAAAFKPVLEVNLTEDELLDTASEVTGDLNMPNINTLDNLGNLGNLGNFSSLSSLTDELRFNLDSITLKPKYNNNNNNMIHLPSQTPVMKLMMTVMNTVTNLTLTVKHPGTTRMTQIPKRTQRREKSPQQKKMMTKRKIQKKKEMKRRCSTS